MGGPPRVCLTRRNRSSEWIIRSGHYERELLTSSGEVTLKMPKLKGVTFETAIIERYRRRGSSVEEALIEMYLAGVSVRRVEDVTEALWGRVSAGTVSELNKKAYGRFSMQVQKFLYEGIGGTKAKALVRAVVDQGNGGGKMFIRDTSQVHTTREEEAKLALKFSLLRVAKENGSAKNTVAPAIPRSSCTWPFRRRYRR